ncbi:Dihydrodipicolinate synthase [Caldalkalibacillus thermarum TA2.A1]|uniref:Dihydrodipicolinate synthase n=1 Tax=Caldalkalibacillus thermarum (strain TA2.A1) TaxID=986075 RepID=F5LAS6_CALTT|nr:dihydrodipicolinate synthase family protein [Caldalkalibacillus thermarum]EGL81465.1 Dihydrodipicolinate synthase [Caldalkalibacillus thermarum TA2.A1]QZT33773.1 dihydrodipicolinate synthase family protein [Caldalkalibacillus thermarum TA2.A1]
MAKTHPFKGIIPPVPTIVDEQGDLDKDGMKKLLDHLIEAGVHGLLILGTGGEFSQMGLGQRKQVAEFAVEYVAKRVPVMIGTGSPSTAETVELSKHAQQAGADGVLVLNPYYWPLAEDHLYAHYARVAEAVTCPILIYNFPLLTGQDLTPAFIKRLAMDYEHIVGLKDTVDTAGHIREIIVQIKHNRPEFAVFAGFDDHLFNTLALGGDGAIPASANFAPEITVGLYEAFQQGDYSRAIQLHRRLAPLLAMYKLDVPFVNVIKEAIRLRGIEISTAVLPPARPLSEQKREKLKQLLQKAQLLS